MVKKLEGGFRPVNSLNSHVPSQSKNEGQQTKPGSSALVGFAGKPKSRGLLSQGQKRGSDNSGIRDEMPPLKKRGGSIDHLEDLGAEVAEIPDPNTKRTRIPRNPYHNNSRGDPFSGGKPKPATKTESIDDTDSDGSSHTESGTPANTSKSADLPRTAFASTKPDIRFKILRASCRNSTYDHNGEAEEKQIYLGLKDLNLRPMNHQGSAVANYDWMEVRPCTMLKIDYCKDFSPVAIHRSGGSHLPPLLHLEFASSDDHTRFLRWVDDRVLKLGNAVTIKRNEHQTSDRLERAFGNSFSASHERNETDQSPPPISPQQPTRSPPVVSPATKERTKRKLAQNMKADHSTFQTTSAATPLDREPSASTVTRSSRRRAAASSGKPVESPTPDFISLDDDGLNSIISKKTRGRAAAPRAPPPARWIDLHPEWVNAWDDKPLIYPSSGRDAAQITKEDIPRLEDNELLNDSLIIFSSRYLLEQQAKEMSSLLGRTYIFNPWFYKKLSLSSKRGIDYEAVKSWTSKVDLFAHDFIIVPVNESFHWYLAIICYPGKLLPQKKEDDDVMMIDGPQDAVTEPQQPAASTSTAQAEREDDDDIVIVESDVLPGPPSRPAQPPALKDQKTAKTTVNPRDSRVITFDSLGGAHSPTCTSLREYLVLEAKHRHGVDIKIPNRFGLTAKGIPEQNDFNSCGAYLLGYLQNFFQNPDGSVERIVLKQGPGWEIDPRVVRAEMRTAIMDARDKQNDQVKKEQEAKMAKKRQRVDRLANGTSPAPSSPLSELPTSGTMNSTEVQQCGKDIESDRLSRGNVTSPNPSWRMVQDEDPKGEIAGTGSGASEVTTEEPAGLNPKITASASSGTHAHVISDTSPEASPITRARAFEGGATESSPGPSAEPFHGPALRDFPNISSETQGLIPDTVVREARPIDGPSLTAVSPRSPVHISSTPSRGLSSSQVADVMGETMSPTLETYKNLLGGSSHEEGPGAVEPICLDSDPPSQASIMEVCDELPDVGDDAGLSSEYYTASEAEASPGWLSKAPSEGVQQQYQRQQPAAKNPLEVDAGSSATASGPVISSYFAPRDDAPRLRDRAPSPQYTKQTFAVREMKTGADGRGGNPFVHMKTTSATKFGGIDLTKEEKEVSVAVFFDLTQEDD